MRSRKLALALACSGVSYAANTEAATPRTVPLTHRMFATPAEYLVSPAQKQVGNTWGEGDPQRLLNYDASQFTALEYVPESVMAGGGPVALYVHLPNRSLSSLPLDWERVFEQRKMIFVSLNGLVALGKPLTSVGLTLDAIATEAARFPVDSARIVVGGVGFDAVVAATVAAVFPERIAGFVSHGAAINWKSFHSADGLHWWNPNVQFLDMRYVTTPLKGKTRFAFIGGERNESFGGYSDYEGMLQSVEDWWMRGLRMRVFDVPGLGTAPAPDAPFGKALDWVLTCSDDGSFPPRFDSDHWPPFTPVSAPRIDAPDMCRSPHRLATYPVANAGPDLTLKVGELAVLDGYTPNLPPLMKYAWEQVTTLASPFVSNQYGPAVSIAPSVPGKYTLRLIIADPSTRIEDTVVVTVVAPPTAPVPPQADPGPATNHCALGGVRASRDVDHSWWLVGILLALFRRATHRRSRLPVQFSIRTVVVPRRWHDWRRLTPLPIAMLSLVTITSRAHAILELDVPLSLRMYPTPEAYFAKTPRAKSITKEDIEALTYKPEEITATRYVPASYATESEPYALYVHIDAGEGFKPDANWQKVFDDQKVLFIAPNRVENEVPPVRRTSVALDALASMLRDYRVDPSRTIVGGLSGGGAVAVQTGVLFPQYFSGVLSHVRPVYWGSELWDLDTREGLRGIKNMRFAFISGEGDWVGGGSNYAGLMTDIENWWWRGLRMRPFDVPGMGHAPAVSEVLAKALRWLFTCYDDGAYPPRFETNHLPPLSPFPHPRATPPNACDGEDAPVAKAGSDMANQVGAPVLLDGSESFDPDGGKPEPLRYTWTQTDGPAAVLRHPTSPRPSFTPDTPGTYIFSLKVSDGNTISSPDDVVVRIRPPLVADISPPQGLPFQGDISCHISAVSLNHSPGGASALSLPALALLGLVRKRRKAVGRLRP